MIQVLIIGAGPNGLMVLERLASRILSKLTVAGTEKIEITIVDRVDKFSGQVYRKSQCSSLLMNTIAGQITAFSGEGSFSEAAPGSGPKLTTWANHAGFELSDNDYAPRKLYGKYMCFVQKTIVNALKKLQNVNVSIRQDNVLAVHKNGNLFVVEFESEKSGTFTHIVLATGHAPRTVESWQQELDRSARKSSTLRFVTASDLLRTYPELAPMEEVGVIGLGLSFYDLIAVYFQDRGGKFERVNHDLRYISSGKEPVFFVGSRAGIPSPARGRNQKPNTFAWRPHLLKKESIEAQAVSDTLEFRQYIFEWIKAEVEFVYHQTWLSRERSPELAIRFAEETKTWTPQSHPPVSTIAEKMGSTPWVFDLSRLARPFAERKFLSASEYKDEILLFLQHDIEQAKIGNISSPLKAALDVLRDCRGLLQEIVDFGGIDPNSYDNEFLRWYAPQAAILSAGPPLFRVEQLKALIEAGYVNIIGPMTEFAPVDCDHFVCRSPAVEGSAVKVKTLIDARVPSPSLKADTTSLFTQLNKDGLVSQFTISNKNGSFETGGLAVTRGAQRIINNDGKIEDRFYSLGIPTEFTRWFTTVGSTRPDQWSSFVETADAIARSILAECH